MVMYGRHFDNVHHVLPGTVQVAVHESSIEPMHKHKKLIYR